MVWGNLVLDRAVVRFFGNANGTFFQLITVDLDMLGLAPGDRVLDLGCGPGRHSWEAFHKPGVELFAVDRDYLKLGMARYMLGGMIQQKIHGGGTARVLCADAGALPFPDRFFDAAIVSEVMEHLPDDRKAAAELARVVRPGGILAVSVPRYFPEKVAWRLFDGYPEMAEGHVRIYREKEILEVLAAAGFRCFAKGLAHGFHTPYWWLKCLAGRNPVFGGASALYGSMLTRAITSRPALFARAERVVNPVLAKSLVLYLLNEDMDETQST